MADNNSNNKNQPKKKKRDEFDADEIFQAPVITREPTSRQAKIGSRVVLRVTATGRPLPSFQWFHNGKKIVGANTDRLTLLKVRRTAIGAYHCEAKNFVGKAASRACMLSLYNERMSQLVIGPKELKVEAGKSFSLKVLSPDADALKDLKVYWVFNGMRIKGAHGLELRIGEAKKKYEGEYKAMVSTGGALESSNVAKVVIVPALSKTAQAPEPAAEEAIAMPPPLPELAAKEESWGDLGFDPEVEESEAPAPSEALVKKKEFLENFLLRWQQHCSQNAPASAAQPRRQKAA